MVTTAAEGGVVPTSFIGGTCGGHPGHVALGTLSGASCGLLRLLGRLAYITGYGRLLAVCPSRVSDNPPLLLNLHATHKTLFFLLTTVPLSSFSYSGFRTLELDVLASSNFLGLRHRSSH